ncbi:uncharacterized protein LOC135367419 isoform X2 [Ornithodoros turicata]|uniref:uncharacterized protein LOC135367419 isoform X2 n=1 Tax=Ornithodoros turicata TaxID=34597 RepID=UPI003138FDD3
MITVFVTLLALHSVLGVERCLLKELRTACSIPVNNDTVATEVIVNICHLPVDVTFNIMVLMMRQNGTLEMAAGYTTSPSYSTYWFLNGSVAESPGNENCQAVATGDTTASALVTVALLVAVASMATFVWKQHRRQKLLEQKTTLDDANAYLRVVGTQDTEEPLPRFFVDNLVAINPFAQSETSV